MTPRQHRRCPKCGTPHLTRRQDEVLVLIATGNETRDIAERLDMSVETVRWHIKFLLRDFDVHNRVQLANKAREMGFVT